MKTGPLVKRLCAATPHPLLPWFTEAQVLKRLQEPGGPEDLASKFNAREELIRLEKVDPLRANLRLSTWEPAERFLEELSEVCCLGGNRAGKSEWAARKVNEIITTIDNAEVWCLSTSFDTSVRDQQPLVWKYLPAEWKSMNGKRTTTCYISYRKQTGFTDKHFTAPNGSQVWFLNYKQDRDVIEGGAIDLAWADELIPVDWVVQLRNRIVDRAGKIIVTFTPVRGYTPTVEEYVTGCQVEEWESVELLPDTQLWPQAPVGHVPKVARCLHARAGVVWFPSKHNPYVNYQALVDTWKNRSTSDILVRLFGVAKKTQGNVLPKFGGHNIVPHDQIPKEGTNYQILDFAWNRNWAMIWLRVWECKGKKRIYVYREWPDYQTYGEWVVPSEKPDGEKGPAQAPLGYGYNEYKRLIAELEQDEVVEERFGDPRSGKAVAHADDGTTSIILKLSEDGGGGPVYVTPATGLEIMEGIALVNEWLDYDEERPLDVDNEPQLYVSDRCGNLAQCMKLWTGMGGQKGASKDFIDLLRMAAHQNIEDLSGLVLSSDGGGGY